LALLASVTDSQLARMVEYPKAENKILRDKLPARITVTPRDRARLVELGTKLGGAIRDLITIVSPRTFARWVGGTSPRPPRKKRKPGRPRGEVERRGHGRRVARGVATRVTPFAGPPP
jgi:hypothetical protein